MYINQLGQLIDSLLREHPLVVIPAVGAVVRQRMHAHLYASKSRLTPPSEELVFNSRLLHNDGLLVSTVASKWGFNLASADGWVTDAISELRFALESGNRVSWPNVGSLSLSADGRIHFVADTHRSVSPQFFGLRPLQLHELTVKTPVRVQAVKAVRQLPVRKIAGYAAAAAIMGLLAWLPFQQGVVDEGRHLVAEMGLMAHVNQPVYTSRAFTPFALNTDLITTDSPTANSPLANDDVQASFEDELLSVHISAFHVIASSFTTLAQAQSELEKLRRRGFSAELATAVENGMFGVSYGRYDSLASAESMLASVRLSNPGAVIVAAH